MSGNGQATRGDAQGTMLGGRYELRKQIGSGGMAVVWRARQHGAAGFQRPVAVKRLIGGSHGFPGVLEMFVEEARVGAALQHPNIVQVLDFGVDDGGEPFLVCEYVDGLHLGQLAAAHAGLERNLPWAVVAAVGVETLRALEAAHERRDRAGQKTPILHRDVTPGNILLDRSGVVKLADFGLARAMDRERTTRPDIVKGKLSYLAPELLDGASASTATDLFGLGVVLWEALTGQRLFQAPTDIEVAHQLKACRVPLLTRLRPDVPLGVAMSIHRALEKEPRRRHRSAHSMAAELREQLRLVPAAGDERAVARCVLAALESPTVPDARAPAQHSLERAPTGATAH